MATVILVLHIKNKDLWKYLQFLYFRSTEFRILRTKSAEANVLINNFLNISKLANVFFPEYEQDCMGNDLNSYQINYRTNYGGIFIL